MKKTKVLWILTGVLVVFNLFFYLTKLGGEKVLLYISYFLPILCALISFICLFLAVKKLKDWDLTKVAWLMLFLGILIFFFGESTYAALDLIFAVDLDVVFPTVADYVWSLGYIPLFIGLVFIFIGYRRSGFPMGKIMVYGILSPILLIILSVVIIYVLMPMVGDPETTGVVKFFYLFYPIGDLFLVIPAALLIYITSLFGKGSISKPWKLLALGFILFTISDILYAYLDWNGKYGSGNLIDLGWVGGYMLIGLSGLYQVELLDSFN